LSWGGGKGGRVERLGGRWAKKGALSVNGVVAGGRTICPTEPKKKNRAGSTAT